MIAVAVGFLISTTLAVVAYSRRWVERPVLIVTSILCTIPSLALLTGLRNVPPRCSSPTCSPPTPS